MRRPPRRFRAECSELEGRSLLATVPGPTLVPFPDSGFKSLRFESPMSPAQQPGSWLSYPTQVVTQQAGEVTVTLVRSDTAGRLQVRVKTDDPYPPVEPPSLAGPPPSGLGGLRPSSVALANALPPSVPVGSTPTLSGVGVNVAPVDQVVTFADGQDRATLTVTILPNAPNPGYVDVTLSVVPVEPLSGVTYPIKLPLDLRILASDPALPPQVVSVFGTREETYDLDQMTRSLIVKKDNGSNLVLGFNQPMDPVEAADVSNYAVRLVRYGAPVQLVKFKAARYDPATQTVTLVPKNRSVDFTTWSTQSKVRRAKPSPGRGPSSNADRGLTDLQGNAINPNTTPGKVELRLRSAAYVIGG